MNKAGNHAMPFVAALGLMFHTQGAGEEIPQLGKNPNPKVIAAMTLEEKAYFVTGTGMKLPGVPDKADAAPTPGAPAVGQVQNLVPGAAGTSYEIPRLGITFMVMADGPAGLRINPTREKDKAT